MTRHATDHVPPRLAAAWVRPEEPSERAMAATATLLRLLGLPVSRPRVRRAFGDHARPAGLSAVVDVLSAFGLEAAPVRVQPAQLGELPLPAVVCLRDAQGESFAVLCGVSERGVTLVDAERGPRALAWEDYGAAATGVAVAVAVPGSAVFPSRLRWALEEAAGRVGDGIRRHGPWIATGAMAGVLGWGAWSAGWAHRIASGLVLAGWFLSVGLAEISMGASKGAGGALARVCRRTERFTCRSVLASPEARLGGRLPYAHLAVGFYASLAVLLAAAGRGPALAPAAWALAAAAAGLSLPLAAHLVRLQARVLRRWCLWCMICHGLNFALAGLAVAALIGGGAAPSPGGLVVLGLAAAAAMLLSLAFYALRSLGASLDAMARQWKALTGDRNVVLAAFHGAAPVPAVAEAGEGRELVFFSQPFCPHCTRMHEAVARLAARFPGLRLVVRLLVDEAPDPAGDFLGAARPIRTVEMGLLLHAVAAVHGPGAFHAALAEVLAGQAAFRSLTPAAALARLGLAAEALRPGLDAAREGLRRDALAAARAGVSGTPSLFLDRRPVPEWAAPEQVALLAESLWAARPA